MIFKANVTHTDKFSGGIRRLDRYRKHKNVMTTETNTYKPITTWRDYVITTAVETGIFGLSGIVALVISRQLSVGVVEGVVLFYAISVVLTLIVLKILRTFFPVPEGVYSFKDNVSEIFLFNLYEVLLLINLGFFYSTNVVPSLVRKSFYKLLGSKVGGGMIVIGGRIEDPHYVVVGTNAIVAEGAMLYPHVISNMDSAGNRLLAIGKIEIGANAIIGSRCTIMPSVTIGENAMVASMSYVPMNTVIPAGEIWSGVPAKKVDSVDSHQSG